MPRTRSVLSAALFLTSCGSFHMNMPADFDADALKVTGQYSALRIGDWRLSSVRRTNTGAGSITSKTGYDQRLRQTYRFRATKGASASGVMCTYSASGRIPALGAYDYVEDANLRCIIEGAQKWLLDVGNDPSNRLAGQLQGVVTYEVRGSAAPSGPVNGFYLEDAGGTVAAVQIAGIPRVFFARGMSERQRDALMPALAALLLLDEKPRAL